MSKVVLVEAFWPSTGASFAQAFEDYESARAKYDELREDTGATVTFTKTNFANIQELAEFLNKQVSVEVGMVNLTNKEKFNTTNGVLH